MKKVTFTAKPSAGNKRPTADDWVQQKPKADEAIKRLTIDIPQSLHTRVKSQCVLRGVNMVDVVREFLEREFRSDHPESPGGTKPATTRKKPSGSRTGN